jgi:hypothetical protein
MTAIEWLVKELEEHHVFHDIKNTNAYQIAKEMEKQQIEGAYDQDLYGGLSKNRIFDNGKQYYNETYGN